MAYTNLDYVSWGSSPTIGFTFDYDYRRIGVNMEYKYCITIDPVTGARYYGYPIYLQISQDGVVALAQTTIKESDAVSDNGQWNDPIVYETGWLTVSNKLSGVISLAISLYSGLGSTRYAVYNYTLPVVPSISLLSAEDGTLGQEQTLTITAYDSSYKHTLEYTCGKDSGTIATKVSDRSIKWTPPIDLAAQNTAGELVPVTLTLKTYSGDTLLGSKSVTVNQTIPNTIVPSLSMFLSDYLGYAEKYGGYVQNRSRLKVTLNAVGAYNSTISSFKITVGNTVYTSNGVTTPILGTVGSIKVVAEVVDSRGRRVRVEDSINVLEYQAAVISALTVSRCDAEGNDLDDGEYAYAQFSGSITSLSGINAAKYIVQYRVVDSSDWIDVSGGTGYTVSNRKVIFAADPNSAYEVRVVAVDAFADGKSEILRVAKEFILFDTDEDMTSWSFGEPVTDKYTFTIGERMKAILKGGLQVIGEIVVDGKKLAEKYAPLGKIAGAAAAAEKLAAKIKIKIGKASKDFDGSADISMTLDEIGAAAKEHSHFVWQRVDVTFVNGVGTATCPGVTTSSKILAMRNTPASDNGQYTGIMSAGCATDGTVALGLDDNSSPTLPVTILWSTT